MKIIKKDGSLVDYDKQKIIDACSKSAKRAMVELTDEDYSKICHEVGFHVVADEKGNTITVNQMHAIVEKVLLELFPSVGDCYRQYRNYKVDFVHMLDDVYTEAQKIMYMGDKENSNSDSSLVTTKRSLVYKKLNRELYRQFFMSRDELQACNDGYIYVHDQSDRRDSINCQIADVEKILTGGFEMANIWYNEPKTLDVAFDVIGDIVLSMASMSYGGYTVPEVDKLLRKYAMLSYETHFNEYLTIAKELTHSTSPTDVALADRYAMNKVQREMEQGYQGWEYKFNTVSSSRGDYPFITITFGLGNSQFEKMASKAFLKVRREGQGKKGSKKPVLFPKLVLLYTDDLYGVGKENEDIFEEAILCSSTTMYPDWLSLDGDTTIAKMYHKYGKVISPMGKCKLAHVKPIEPCSRVYNFILC